MFTWIDWAILMLVVAATPTVVTADVKQARIPNGVIGFLLICAAILSISKIVVSGSFVAVAVALIVAVATLGALLGIAALVPNSIGMGDVKLISGLAWLLSLMHPSIFLYSMLATAVLGGVAAAGIVLRGTASQFAYGPVIMAGSFLGLGYAVYVGL